jgi:hypothetical protein
VNAKDLKNAYRSMLNSDDGIKVLDDLERRFGLHRTSYVPNSDETIFREGQRDVVLFLRSTLKDLPKE